MEWKMITLKFPLGLRPPTPEEWHAVWRITGIPPGTKRVANGRWVIPVPEERLVPLVAYLQALALDSGFIYAPPPEAAGWLPWSGSERPEPATVLVEYKMRCGLIVARGTPAGEVRWSHAGTGSDVVAYRRK